MKRIDKILQNKMQRLLLSHEMIIAPAILKHINLKLIVQQ